MSQHFLYLAISDAPFILLYVWSYDMTNVSTLAVSVPINLSIKLGFVPANRPRETYFVNALHTLI